MTTLLELKEKLVRFYGKNEVYILPVIRFIVAVATFLMINKSIGYMKMISTTPIAVILALVCSVLPWNALITVSALVILLDLYALSIEVCIVGLLIFAVVYFVYFRFAPKCGVNAVLMPISFKLSIPYAVPVGTGLLNEGYSVVSVACGTIIYFFLQGVCANAGVLGDKAEDSEETVSKIVVTLNQLVGNKEMYLVLAVFVAATLLVYVIRKLNIEHSWTIALSSGIVFQEIGLAAGYTMLGIQGKITGIIVGGIVSWIIAFVIQFFFFNLDYSRTERLQFEDDEYYYYVKAVPKSLVTEKDKQIKRFNAGAEKERLNKKKFAEEMDIDENLLD